MDIYILRIQSSVNVRLCCFHFFLKIMLLWTLIHKSLCVHVFISPGCIPNSNIAE